MKISFYIAFRYFLSKKSTQAINIIAGISLVGFAIGVFAMIVVLSTMNGFEKLVFGMYNDFNPAVRIMPKIGKVMPINPKVEAYIKENFKNASISATLEDNASCEYGNFQYICRIKGVEQSYAEQANLQKHLINGEIPSFTSADSNTSMLGQGVDYKLAALVTDPNCYIKINAPKRISPSIDNQDDIHISYTKPIGVFSYDDAINNKYILVSLPFAQQLFERTGEISSYEIYINDNKHIEKYYQLIKNKFGNQYEIKTRYMLNESLYRMFKTEKWFTFAILSFVLIIVSFNLMGSLTLLVIEKKGDIKIMKSMGMTTTQVRNIFFLEGIIISFFGTIIGLLLGLTFCALQIKYGFISISGAIVDSYPMYINYSDVALSLITALIIGVFAAIYPAKKASKVNV